MVYKCSHKYTQKKSTTCVARKNSTTRVQHAFETCCMISNRELIENKRPMGP